MGTVTLSAAGVGAAQSGTVTTAAGSAAGSIMVTNHSDGAITFNVATAGNQIGFLVPAQFASRLLEGLSSKSDTSTPNFRQSITEQLVRHQDTIDGLPDL